MRSIRFGRNRLLSAALLLAGGLVLAAITVEVLVRAFFDEPVQPRFFIDSGYGVRSVQPNVSTRHYVPGEYEVDMRTNSVGIRGVAEYPVERVPGTHRVLMLGDSFVFGYGVGDHEVVSAVVERKLGAAGHRWEVLNLAVSGFGQAEELITYRERGRGYNTDVVVLFYFDNDIGNNAVANLFELGPDGKLRRTENEYLPGVKLSESLYSIAPIRWLFEHSEAWNLIRNRLSSAVQRMLLNRHGLQRFDDVEPQAVALTRSLLQEFVREIIQDGAVPILFVIPNGRNLSTNFPLDDAEVSTLGARLVDGRDFLTTEDYYVRDSHWRPSGHRKAAEGLTATIAPLFPVK